jgi:hypothetical protein
LTDDAVVLTPVMNGMMSSSLLIPEIACDADVPVIVTAA